MLGLEMTIGGWLTGAAGLAAGLAIIVNLPTRLWLPAQKATLNYLAETELKALDKEIRVRPAVEALELSSLKPQLDAHDVNLYAVVHETLGVEEFRAFFKGDIFLDKERCFYGPRERWMFFSGFLRLSVWTNMYRASQKKVPGNMKGEGRLLGGVYVVGPGEQGIVLEHREEEWGNQVNLTQVLDAAATIAQYKQEMQKQK